MAHAQNPSTAGSVTGFSGTITKSHVGRIVSALNYTEIHHHPPQSEQSLDSDEAIKIFNIPSVNLFFAESRKSLLLKLHNTIANYPGNNMPHIVVISGIMGIGKSQLAIKYANEQKQTFGERCLWIDASDEHALLSSFRGLAALLHIGELNKGLMIKAIYQKLDKLGKTLLIFDNARSEKKINAYMPQPYINRQNLYFLITTINQKSWISYPSIKLDCDNEEIRSDCLKYIKDHANPENETEQTVIRLAETLGYLPLAIAQAVSYIEECKISITEYIQLFDKKKEELLSKGQKVDITYKKTVLIAFRLALDRIKSKKEEAYIKAIEVIQTSAYFCTRNIDRQMLANYFVNADAGKFNKIIKILHSFSIIEFVDSRQYFNMHALLQETVRIGLEKKSYVKLAVDAVYAYIFDNKGQEGLNQAIDIASDNFIYNRSKLRQLLRFLPHALEVISHAERLNHSSRKLAKICYAIGVYYLDGQYDIKRAKRFLEKSKELHNKSKSSKTDKAKIIRQLYKAYLRNACTAKTEQKKSDYFNKAEEYLEQLEKLKVIDRYIICCDYANFYLRKIEFYDNQPIIKYLNTSVALLKFTDEEIISLKRLIGHHSEKVNNLDLQNSNYKNTSFTPEEISEIKQSLDSINTKEAKELNAKLVLKKSKSEQTVKLTGWRKTFGQMMKETKRFLDEAKSLQVDRAESDQAMLEHYYGSYHLKVSQYKEAIFHFSEALKMKEEIHDLREIARTHVGMARAKCKLHEMLKQRELEDDLLKEAEQHLKQALAVQLKFYGTVNFIEIAGSLDILSDVLNEQNDMSQKIQAVHCRVATAKILASIKRKNINNGRKLIALLTDIGRLDQVNDFTATITSFALLKFTDEEVILLKRLIDHNSEKIKTLDPQVDNYKTILFTPEEIKKIKQSLDTINTKEAKDLSAKIVDKYQKLISDNPDVKNKQITNYYVNNQQLCYDNYWLRNYSIETLNKILGLNLPDQLDEVVNVTSVCSDDDATILSQQHNLSHLSRESSEMPSRLDRHSHGKRSAEELESGRSKQSRSNREIDEVDTYINQTILLQDRRIIKICQLEEASGDGNCGFRSILGGVYLKKDNALFTRSGVIDLLKSHLSTENIRLLIAKDIFAKYKEWIASQWMMAQDNLFPDEIKTRFTEFKQRSEQNDQPNYQEQLMQQLEKEYCRHHDTLLCYLEHYLIHDEIWPHVQGSLVAFGNILGIKVHCFQKQPDGTLQELSDIQQVPDIEYKDEVFILQNEVRDHFDSLKVEIIPSALLQPASDQPLSASTRIAPRVAFLSSSPSLTLSDEQIALNIALTRSEEDQKKARDKDSKEGPKPAL